VIKVSVFYPRSEGGQFDAGYYCESHMPMVKACLGDACLGLSVQVATDTRQPFFAVGEMLFASVESMQAAYAPHGKAFADDLPNYTEVVPMRQLSVVTPV
jgi:uncharacterized protein (TIGR02118 family)